MFGKRGGRLESIITAKEGGRGKVTNVMLVAAKAALDSHRKKSEGSLQTWVVNAPRGIKSCLEYQKLFRLVYDKKKGKGK